MKIPIYTQKPRFYVAISLDEAFSSWNTLEEAKGSIARFPQGDPDLRKIGGVVETGCVRSQRWVWRLRTPINEHDEWLESTPPILRSEVVAMVRQQLATRDEWLAEMLRGVLPVWQVEERIRNMKALAPQYALGEQILIDYGDLFPVDPSDV